VPKVLTVNSGPYTQPTLPVHHTNLWVSGLMWLVAVVVAVAVMFAFVWTFTTLRQHLKEHELRDREREPDL
jgi:hypothetical protein